MEPRKGTLLQRNKGRGYRNDGEWSFPGKQYFISSVDCSCSVDSSVWKFVEVFFDHPSNGEVIVPEKFVFAITIRTRIPIYKELCGSRLNLFTFLLVFREKPVQDIEYTYISKNIMN